MTLRLTFASLLLLAACGQAAPTDLITVRTYTDVAGHVAPPTGNLGYTYFGTGRSSARHGEPGWNVMLNPVLADGEPDDDRLTRVVIHEFANVIILDTGDVPPYGPGWYAWDSDTLPPFTEIGPDEAAWFARHGTYRVNVKDDWLRQPTAEAINRIAVACGVEVFR